MAIEQDAARYIDSAVETINARDRDGYGTSVVEDVTMCLREAIDGSAAGREARVDLLQGIICASC